MTLKASTLKVSEISVSIGITQSIGQYEFARVDIMNKATLDEPLEVGSKEYRLAHRDLTVAVEGMVNKALAQVVPDEPAAQKVRR